MNYTYDSSNNMNNTNQYPIMDSSSVRYNSRNQSNQINYYMKEELFEKYKNDLKLLHIENNSDDVNSINETTIFTKEDINFLQKTLEIKNKILILGNKYKKYQEESKNIKDELLKIEKTIEMYYTFNNLYSDLIKNDFNLIPNNKIDSKLLDIDNILKAKQSELNKNEDNTTKIFNQIKMLREIINTRDLTEEDDKITKCSICDTDKIEYCLNPCGHSFCYQCSNHAVSSCHTCRGYIQSKIKLYF